MRIFIAALFVITPSWTQPRRPPAGERQAGPVLHIVEHGQQRKGPDADSVTAGVVLKEGMLSEQSRQRAVTEDVTPFTQRSQKDGVALEVGVQCRPRVVDHGLWAGCSLGCFCR